MPRAEKNARLFSPSIGAAHARQIFITTYACVLVCRTSSRRQRITMNQEKNGFSDLPTRHIGCDMWEHSSSNVILSSWLYYSSAIVFDFDLFQSARRQGLIKMGCRSNSYFDCDPHNVFTHPLVPICPLFTLLPSFERKCYIFAHKNLSNIFFKFHSMFSWWNELYWWYLYSNEKQSMLLESIKRYSISRIILHKISTINWNEPFSPVENQTHHVLCNKTSEIWITVGSFLEFETELIGFRFLWL